MISDSSNSKLERFEFPSNKMKSRRVFDERKSFEYRNRGFFAGFCAFCRKSKEGRCNGYTQMMRGLFIFFTRPEKTRNKKLGKASASGWWKKNWEYFFHLYESENMWRMLEVNWMLMDFSFAILTSPKGSDFWAVLKIQKPFAIGEIIQSNSSSFN